LQRLAPVAECGGGGGGWRRRRQSRYQAPLARRSQSGAGGATVPIRRRWHDVP